MFTYFLTWEVDIVPEERAALLASFLDFQAVSTPQPASCALPPPGHPPSPFITFDEMDPLSVHSQSIDHLGKRHLMRAVDKNMPSCHLRKVKSLDLHSDAVYFDNHRPNPLP
jgi:hypothetical protein